MSNWNEICEILDYKNPMYCKWTVGKYFSLCILNKCYRTIVLKTLLTNLRELYVLHIIFVYRSLTVVVIVCGTTNFDCLWFQKPSKFVVHKQSDPPGYILCLLHCCGLISCSQSQKLFYTSLTRVAKKSRRKSFLWPMRSLSESCLKRGKSSFLVRDENLVVRFNKKEEFQRNNSN